MALLGASNNLNIFRDILEQSKQVKLQWFIVLKSLKFTCAVPNSTPPLPSLHRISTGVRFSMVQTLKVSDTDQAYLKVNWKALGSKKEKNQGVSTLIFVHF